MNNRLQWEHARRGRPCPLCGSEKPGGSDFCSSAETPDGPLARCPNTPQGSPPAGWRFVKLDATGAPMFANGNGQHRPAAKPLQAYPPLSQEQLIAIGKRYAQAVTPAKLQTWADRLGLPAVALQALGAGADSANLTWPERAPDGSLRGFAIRKIDGWKGWAHKTGEGRRGVIIPASFTEQTKTAPDVLIVEGPTDAAACWALGLCAIGRLSNTGGADDLIALLKPTGKAALIVGELDGKVNKVQWPGYAGADVIARRLQAAGVPARWTLPPAGYKDVRAWALAQGLKPETPLADWHKAGEILRAELGRNALSVQADWPAINPLDSEPEPPALDLWSCFPAELAPVRDFIRAVSVSLQVPADLPALLALSAASLAVCGAYELCILPDWQETPPLWSCPLAEPGERKSAVFKIITRPITEWQKSQAVKLSREIAEQQESRKQDERLLDKLRGVGGSPDKDMADRTQARQQAMDLAGKLASEPILHAPQLLASDATPEAVAELLARNGERLGLFAAEGDAVDVLLGRYSDRPNMGIYLSAWGGESYTVNRRGREPLHLSRPTLVFGLCIQPQAIAAMLADPDARGRGLLARFMFAWPASGLGYREIEPPPIPEHLTQDWQGRITRLLNLERPGDVVKGADAYTRRGGSPVMVRLSAGAAGLFRVFRVACEPELRPDGGELGGINGWGSKLPGAIARIALSFHALTGNPEPAIPETIMRAAIGWADYLIQHYKAVAGPLKADPTVQQARRLLDWIRRDRLPRFVFRDMQALRTGEHPDLESWQPVYRVLCERGYLRPDRKEAGAIGGRPSDGWTVNPAFFESEGEHTPHKTHETPLQGAGG